MGGKCGGGGGGNGGGSEKVGGRKSTFKGGDEGNEGSRIVVVLENGGSRMVVAPESGGTKKISREAFESKPEAFFVGLYSSEKTKI
ncbi:hypothetical protein V6N13_054097 [Hibiscus sabdariffa]|uniref:Uncharacterized protein n=1 Tax=Hibiscus sabdariffa TaxID=183260 RepID=A0ABR2T6B5_9ROSI